MVTRLKALHDVDDKVADITGYVYRHQRKNSAETFHVTGQPLTLDMPSRDISKEKE